MLIEGMWFLSAVKKNPEKHTTETYFKSIYMDFYEFMTFFVCPASAKGAEAQGEEGKEGVEECFRWGG